MQGNDTISELVAALRKAVIEAELDRPQREIDPPEAPPKAFGQGSVRLGRAAA